MGSESYDIIGKTLDINMIQKILPHRYPFLFVDRVVHLEKGKRAVGVKNVTINDSFFAGHFPGHPVMPGVIIVEAMAQLGGVMMLSPEENRGKIAYFMSANNIKFRKTVLPGDQLVLEAEAVKIKSRTGQDGLIEKHIHTFKKRPPQNGFSILHSADKKGRICFVTTIFRVRRLGCRFE